MIQVNGQFRLRFHARKDSFRPWKHQNRGKEYASLNAELEERNIIAHSLNVQDIVASFNNFEFFYAIVDRIQKGLPKIGFYHFFSEGSRDFDFWSTRIFIGRCNRYVDDLILRTRN